MNREEDIQTLCLAVLENAVRWEYDPNSYDYYECIFCNARIKDTGKLDDKIYFKQIEHKLNCPYLIAKDLSTKL